MDVIASNDAFLALVQALALDGVHVGYHGSGKLPKVNELLFVMPVTNYRSRPGEQYEIETYDLGIRVEVFRSGEFSGRDADARRWQIIMAVDEELRNRDFKGYATHGGEMTTSEESLDLYTNGWIASSRASFGMETWR